MDTSALRDSLAFQQIKNDEPQINSGGAYRGQLTSTSGTLTHRHTHMKMEVGAWSHDPDWACDG